MGDHRGAPVAWGDRRFAAGVTATIVAVLLLATALTTTAHSARAKARAATTGGIHALVNAERAERGLDPLSGDRRLARAARAHSRDMVRNDFFSHTGRDGDTVSARVRATGYFRGARRWRVGETLAWAAGRDVTDRRLVEMLMGSPAHRAVLLDPRLEELGVGLVTGAPRRVRRGTRAMTVTLVLGAVERRR